MKLDRFSLRILFFLPILWNVSFAVAGGFEFSKDRFGFANETVWDYEAGRPTHKSHTKHRHKRYSRRCFVLCRAAIQFWKFARFDPKGQPLSDSELARRIRQVTEREAWQDPLPPHKRVLFPGARSLWELSSQRPEVFRRNLGLGWPIYFRPGNAVLLIPPSPREEHRVYQKLWSFSRKGIPSVAWLANFPSLNINHAVVVFASRKTSHPNQTEFLVYDPNYTDHPKRLIYDAHTRSFSYQPTFYFPGGKVGVRLLYQRPWQ